MTVKEETLDVETGPNQLKSVTLENDTTAATSKTASNGAPRKRNEKQIIAFGLIITAIVVGVTVPLSVGRQNNTESIPPQDSRTTEDVERNMLLFDDIKLPVSLREFNSDILSGYDTCSDLKDDVEQALNDYANILIQEDMNNFYSFDDYLYHDIEFSSEAEPMVMEMAAESPGIATTSFAGTSTNTKESPPIMEDSFGTNNQHEDVDEADIIKSDGTFIYTVYGPEIVVLDIDGTEVFRLDVAIHDNYYYDYHLHGYDNSNMEPILMEEETTETVSISNPESSASSTTTTSSASAQRSSINDSNNNRRTSMMFPQSASIRALLLHESRLIAILSGYNYDYRSFSASSTDIVTIDIDLSTGALSIVEIDNASSLYTSINGDFQAARMIGSNAHIVTTAYMSHWDFSGKFSRYHKRYANLDDVDYAKAALEVAGNLIPNYAHHLVRELIMMDNSKKIEESSETMMEEKNNSDKNNDMMDFDTMLNSIPITTCQHIAKLSTYQNGKEENDNFTGLQGVLNGFVRVFSFDMQSGPADSENTSISASFVPSGYADVYATSDMLFLGGRGWTKTVTPIPFDAKEDDVEDLPPTDVTYVTAFQLDGASAIPKATGVIPGYTLNQFSFDYFDDHLRVATSTNEVRVWNEETWESKVIRESTNQVIVAQIQDSTIEIVGKLENLGITERIFAVRFLGDRAYMVTFRQIDPFYAIDLSVPTDPIMRGELKIPGFSNYLHPVEDNYILAVGQDADEQGRQLGLQIALFDVSDLDNPQQIAKHVVKMWSSSTSQHDHFAFRYLPSSQKLILPISTGDFDGFHVFDIHPSPPATSIASDGNSNSMEQNTGGGIVFDFAIPHFDIEDEHKDGFKCYSFNYLTPRSLVFQGDVMTLKGHTVLLHDLTTGERLSRTDLDENLSNGEGHMCYGWYLW